MYVDDAVGALGKVDVATGGVEFIGHTGIFLTDIAFDSAGNLFGISFTDLYAINSTTAAASLIGAHGIAGANALVFGTNGTLYAAGFGTTSLFTVNPATGASTNIGDMGFASAGDLAFNDGKFYLAALTSQLVSVNLADLASSVAVGFFGVNNVFGLATGDDGQLYGVAGNQIFVVNTATGQATNPVDYGLPLLAANGQSFFGEAVPSVPEPGTFMLVAAGVSAMALRRKRTRNRPSVHRS
jgi:hypothetical protein